MTNRQLARLEGYIQIGRKAILEFTDRFSCVSSTKLTILTLAKLGIKCTPQAVKFAFTVPELDKAYSCGLSHKELAAVGGPVTHRTTSDGTPGWRGHLVAITEDRRYLLDSSLDQVDMAFEEKLGLPTRVYVFSVPANAETDTFGEHGFKLNIDGVTITGLNFNLQYVTVEDNTYADSPAWNDPGIPFLAHNLANQVRGESPRNRLKGVQCR